MLKTKATDGNIIIKKVTIQVAPSLTVVRALNKINTDNVARFALTI